MYRPCTKRRIASGKIGGNGYLLDLITEAAQAGGTDESRRQFVADRIIMVAKGVGLEISQTQAMYLVQHGYALFKKITTKPK